jgi:hypothetical protein
MLAILLTLFVAAPAAAQDEPAFEDLIADAKTAFDAEEYQKAIDLLLYAHRIQPNPRLLINVAKSYEKMDDCKSALVYYNAYLREPEVEDALLDVAEKAVDDANCPEYDRTTAGRLIIKSEPRGATILVDGKNVGVTPFEVAGLENGNHKIRLELDGYEPFETNVSLSYNTDGNVSTKLVEKKAEPVVTTPDPDPTPDPVVTEPADEGVNPMIYVAGGIAAVGVGLLAFGAVQDLVVIPGIDDDRAQFPVGSQDYQNLTDDRASAANLALIGYIGGSLLALGGGGWLVYMLFFDKPAEKPTVDIGPGVDLRPVVRHDGGGFILEGRF